MSTPSRPAWRVLAALGAILATSGTARATLRCEAILSGIDFLERRISPETMATTQLRDGESALVDPLVEALERGDWSAPVFTRTDPRAHLRAALSAYRAGRIHQEQLATLSLRWAAFEDFRVGKVSEATVAPLLDPGGRLTDVAQKLFSESEHDLNGLEPGHLEAFRARLAEFPASERVGWVVRIPTELVASDSRRHWGPGYRAVSIRRTMRFLWRLNGGRRSRKDGPEYTFRIGKDVVHLYGTHQTLFVPSFGVIQTYLDASNPGTSVRLIPEFGTTGIRGVLDGIARGGRIFALQFPGVDGVTEAEGIAMGRFFASLHDFDHAAVGSKIDPAYRRFMARVARVLLDASATARDEIEHRAETIADLYFSSGSLTDKRWGSRLINDLGPVEGRVLPLLIADMARRPETYRELGVNPKDLLDAMGPTAKKIYDQFKTK